MLRVPSQIPLLSLLYAEFAEPCDQPKRDRAASQSQRAEKPVPASHARSGQSVPKGRGGHREASIPPGTAREGLTAHFQVGSLREPRDCRQAGLRAAGGRSQDSGMGARIGAASVHFPGAGQRGPPRPVKITSGTRRDSDRIRGRASCPLPRKVVRLPRGEWPRTGLPGPVRQTRGTRQWSPAPHTSPLALLPLIYCLE